MRYLYTTILCAALVFGAACSSFEPVKERIEVDLRARSYPAGQAEAEFDKALSLTELVKLDLGLSYYPEDDVVCLQFRRDFTTYYQFWSKTNRDAFVIALEMYKGDYAQRTLVNSNMRTKRQYNTVRGYLIWESSQFSNQGINYPNIEIGYYFKRGAPYFALTMREETNTNDITKDAMPQSSNIVMYFTRAQADILAALFNQEYLRGLNPAPATPGSVGEPEVETGEPYAEGAF